MQNRQVSMGKEANRPPGSRPITPPMRRLIDRMGYLPNFSEIAREAGLLRMEVSHVMLCRRATKRVRKAVARWAGMRESQLFADCDGTKKGAAA